MSVSVRLGDISVGLGSISAAGAIWVRLAAEDALQRIDHDGGNLVGARTDQTQRRNAHFPGTGSPTG